MTDLNNPLDEYQPYTIFKQHTRKTPHYNLLVKADDGCFYQLPYIQLWGRKYEEYTDKVSEKQMITTKLETANIVLELTFINFGGKFSEFTSELGSFNVENITHCDENLHLINFPAVKVRCLQINEAHFFGEKEMREDSVSENG